MTDNSKYAAAYTVTLIGTNGVAISFGSGKATVSVAMLGEKYGVQAAADEMIAEYG